MAKWPWKTLLLKCKFVLENRFFAEFAKKYQKLLRKTEECCFHTVFFIRTRVKNARFQYDFRKFPHAAETTRQTNRASPPKHDSDISCMACGTYWYIRNLFECSSGFKG